MNENNLKQQNSSIVIHILHVISFIYKQHKRNDYRIESSCYLNKQLKNIKTMKLEQYMLKNQNDMLLKN